MDYVCCSECDDAAFVFPSEELPLQERYDQLVKKVKLLKIKHDKCLVRRPKPCLRPEPIDKEQEIVHSAEIYDAIKLHMDISGSKVIDPLSLLE